VSVEKVYILFSYKQPSYIEPTQRNVLDLMENYMDEKLLEYRKDLIKTVQKLNENYDKLIITLSGGAFGLSLVFVKDFVGSDLGCQ